MSPRRRKKPKPLPPDDPLRRFGDSLVVAAPGEVVDHGYVIDRRLPEYHWGVEAKRAGKRRDISKSLEWLAGYDETPPPKEKPA